MGGWFSSESGSAPGPSSSSASATTPRSPSPPFSNVVPIPSPSPSPPTAATPALPPAAGALTHSLFNLPPRVRNVAHDYVYDQASPADKLCGGKAFKLPRQGWQKIALNVSKYGDTTWLTGSPDSQWPVSYSPAGKAAAERIAVHGHRSRRTNLKTYQCIEDAQRLCALCVIKGRTYSIIIMNRINPSTLRETVGSSGNAVYTTPTAQDVRPYAILFIELRSASSSPSRPSAGAGGSVSGSPSSTTTSTHSHPFDLPKEYLEPGHDFLYTVDDPPVQSRGGHPFYPPIAGWRKVGIKIIKHGEDLTWMHSTDEEGVWAISYHGTSLASALEIVKHGYDMSKLVRFAYGRGVYSTPHLERATTYARQRGTFLDNGKPHVVVLMNRVNPSAMRRENSNYYYVTPRPEDIRPYALLFKEV